MSQVDGERGVVTAPIAPTPELIAKLAMPGRKSWEAWPTYDAATLGLHNFWYPVAWSREIKSKPTPVTLLGENIMLIRDQGTVYALADRCAHRGVPLHFGKQQFPGTISCPYHGWTYSLESGLMCAAITDGPDSPIACKVAVRAYPVEERLGLVWLYAGDGQSIPPPVEKDIPEELIESATVVEGTITPGRRGNWRYAAENGFDEGHAKFLHRNALWVLFRQMPVWSNTEIVHSADGIWVSRRWTNLFWEAEFPGLGKWTQRRWWKFIKTGAKKSSDPVIRSMDLPGMVSVRMPYILRVAYGQFFHYEWAIPEDADHHRYVQLMVSFKRRTFSKLWFRILYRAYIRWAFHGQFTGQDAWMVDVMDVPPERLYRPDSAVIAYRKLVEEQHRNTITAPE